MQRKTRVSSLNPLVRVRCLWLPSFGEFLIIIIFFFSFISRVARDATNKVQQQHLLTFSTWKMLFKSLRSRSSSLVLWWMLVQKRFIESDTCARIQSSNHLIEYTQCASLRYEELCWYSIRQCRVRSLFVEQHSCRRQCLIRYFHLNTAVQVRARISVTVELSPFQLKIFSLAHQIAVVPCTYTSMRKFVWKGVKSSRDSLERSKCND